MVQLGEKQQAIDTITLMEDLAEAARSKPRAAWRTFRSLPTDCRADERGSLRAHREGKVHSAEPDLFRFVIQEQALAAGDDADVILDRAESTIFQLAEDRVKAGLIGVKDLVKESFDRLEKIFSEGRRITGLATGYAGLDNETAGLQPSELIILAARPQWGRRR